MGRIQAAAALFPPLLTVAYRAPSLLPAAFCVCWPFPRSFLLAFPLPGTLGISNTRKSEDVKQEIAA